MAHMYFHQMMPSNDPCQLFLMDKDKVKNLTVKKCLISFLGVIVLSLKVGGFLLQCRFF